MSKDLRSNYAPLYCISKLFFLTPFSMNITKRTAITPSIIGSMYSAIFMIGYVTFHLYSAENNFISADADSEFQFSFVSFIIETYNKYIGVSLFMITIMSAIMNQKKMIQFLTIVEKVDSEFNQCFGIVDVGNVCWMRISMGRIIWLLCLLSTFENFNCLMFIRAASYSEYCLIMCFGPMIVNALTEMLFISYLSLIRNRLAKMNSLIDEMKGDIGNKFKIDEKNFIISEFYQKINKVMPEPTKTDYKFVRGLISIQKMYGWLYEGTISLMSAFGIPLLFLFLIQFTTLTTLLFYCATNVIKYVDDGVFTADEIAPTLSSLGWILIFMEKIFSICYICNQTKFEAQRIGPSLHFFGLSVEDETSKKTIKWFSLQILNQKFCFTACGLFQIDLTLMYSVYISLGYSYDCALFYQYFIQISDYWSCFYVLNNFNTVQLATEFKCINSKFYKSSNN